MRIRDDDERGERMVIVLLSKRERGKVLLDWMLEKERMEER